MLTVDIIKKQENVAILKKQFEIDLEEVNKLKQKKK